jgi:hypothetical protein
MLLLLQVQQGRLAIAILAPFTFQFRPSDPFGTSFSMLSAVRSRSFSTSVRIGRVLLVDRASIKRILGIS